MCVCTHKQWNAIQPQKRMKFSHLKQCGWTWTYNVRERQILYDISCVCLCVCAYVHMCWYTCCVWLSVTPMEYSPLGSSVHGILQARIVKWPAISVSRGSSWPRDRTSVSYISCIGRQVLYHWVTWEAQCFLTFIPISTITNDIL